MIENEDIASITLDAEPLWTHARRPQWGVGLLTAAGDGRRRLQFQDGRVRTFKEGFYHLLEPFEGSETAAAIVQEELDRKHRTLQKDAAEVARARAKPPVMSFDEQRLVFADQYPGGFSDADYHDAWRDRPDARRKRHVDRAIELAAELLDVHRIGRAVVHGETGAVFDDLLRVMKLTSLASPTKVVAPLASLDEETRAEVVTALHGVLTADDEQREDRMRAWLLALDAGGRVAVTWPMVTLPLALIQPQDHVCVKPRVFRRQARILGGEAMVRRLPSPLGYAAAQRVARETRESLASAGLSPNDTFDLRAFMWETLRPKGIERLASLRI